jgi:AraC-like DNA-binding protein
MHRGKEALKPAESMVRIGTALGVPKVLRSLGLDPETVLTEAGVDVDIFNDPDNTISFSAHSRLIAHCAAVTDCEHFGLLTGQHAGLHSLGLMGLLVKYSPDVSTALNNLNSFFHLHTRAAVLSVEEHGSVAVLGYRIVQGWVEGNDLVSEGALAVLFNIMRELCGPRWAPTEVWSARKKPENVAPYRQFFKVRLRFDAEQDALLFPSTWLTQALPEVHAEVRQLVQKQIDLLVAQHPDDFPQQVRNVLHAALISGDARATRVATLLSIHPRTLHRRLQAFGLGYQQLVDECRFGIAKRLLTTSDRGVSEIAQMLHYADARTFIRAFRRWSGETPARWRATQTPSRRVMAS